MAQFVVEFGAEQLRFVLEAIKSTVSEPFRMSVDAADSQMFYTGTSKNLDEVAVALQERTVASVCIRTGDPRIRYALITSPMVHVPPLGLWMGTVEVQVDDWSFVWDALVRQAGLRFVSVGLEEGLELSDDLITIETFPWHEQRLLAGAVRDTVQSDWCQRVCRAPGS